MIDFITQSGGGVSRREIARAFNIKGETRAELRRLLTDLEESGALEKDSAKRVRATDTLPKVLPVDVMSVDEDGDLLLMPSKWESSRQPPLIKLAMRAAAKLKPSPGVGDRLLVRLHDEGDDGYSANVIKQLDRSAHRFLAVFRQTKFGGVADPVERRAKQKFTIGREDTKGAQTGDLVWLDAASGRKGETRARIREIAGHVDDKGSFSLIALANHNIPVDFPPLVIAEAEKAQLPPLGDRTDLRALPLLTIDPFDAKDHDDAVWAANDDDKENSGGFKVVVAIADVSWFVRYGSALDREARRRGNSVYLPDRVVPMLPERLSNDLCSLREGEDRPCLAVEIILDKKGVKRRHKFMRAMMRSHAKLSYEDAQALVEIPSQDEVGKTITVLKAAFDARWHERSKRAPLDLDLPERKIVIGKSGDVTRVEVRERFDAHRLIEELMILANISAAETLERAKRAQIYRVHDAPDEDKLESVRTYLDGLDYSLIKGGSVRPQNFNQLLKIAESRDEKEMVSEIILRAQQQAVYSTENLGHFGLNLPRYSHFTSPIRRYADLTIHRALVRAVGFGEGGQTNEEVSDLSETAEEISDLERRAMAAERESKDRYLAGYLEEHVGEEFDARIRGVTRFGLFVMLDVSGADGFIPMRSLGFERFRFDEEHHAVVGETTGGVYRLGQGVRVKLVEAAPLSGSLRFDMLSDPLDLPQFKKKNSKHSPSGKNRTRPASKKKIKGSKPKRGNTQVKSGNDSKSGFASKPSARSRHAGKKSKSNAKRRRSD